MPHLRQLLAVSVLAMIAATPARAVEANCSAPRAATEAAVCGSPVLSNLDERMNRFYGWLWAALDDAQRMSLKTEQRKFAAARIACVDDLICLRTAYLTRIEELSVRLKQITDARVPAEARCALASVPAVRS